MRQLACTVHFYILIYFLMIADYFCQSLNGKKKNILYFYIDHLTC